ncbi:MAG: phosphoribosylaminoimidazolesuccinocarboxamide synthase [Myxococcales bacterium]|nr:phosphoribosylaminoimidazolesuccinocarboxamide synthase [Myxococcales bacterium]
MIDTDVLRAALPGALETVDLSAWGEQIDGKVREMVRVGDRRILVTTDRVSAFDRVLGTIPLKGQVLNQLSAWWFSQIEDIVGHHLVAVPDPNVMVTREAEPLPVEVIVRGHITGSTSTSLWTLYSQGVEKPYGLDLPPGLKQHERLAVPVITPTTKAAKGEHDERLTSAEVVERGLVDPELWDRVQTVALALFARGQEIADRAGFVMADTKYEFGMVDGELVLIDEVHTPDSSRYWARDAWERAMVEGGDPPSADKEKLRLWLKSRGFKGDGEAPVLPDDVRVDIASTYVATFERITGQTFVPAEQPVGARIVRNLTAYLEA